MEAPKLRLFSLAADSSSDAVTPKRPASASPTMPVAVRDLVPLLVDAFQTDRTWLKDFEHEHIQVTPDLYDVLLAYQQLRRCNAA